MSVNCRIAVDSFQREILMHSEHNLNGTSRHGGS
jgi:hypothetical protein